MADRPELLRLFDVAESPFDIPSKTETTDATSRNTTTPKAPSAEATHDSGAPERDGDAEVLRRCVVAAGLMNHARVEFDDAVAAARATGHTCATDRERHEDPAPDTPSPERAPEYGWQRHVWPAAPSELTESDAEHEPVAAQALFGHLRRLRPG
jgi:hypothetical protein